MGRDKIEAERHNIDLDKTWDLPGAQERMQGKMELDERKEKRYVIRLETNIKRRANIELGRKILVIGKNGTGKSAFVDAYSLAVTGVGQSTGVGRGKIVRDSGSVDDGPAYVETTLSDGEVVRWPDNTTGGSDAGLVADKAILGDDKRLQSFLINSLSDLDPRDENQSWTDELMQRSEGHVPEVFRGDLVKLIEESDAFSVDSLIGFADEKMQKINANLSSLEPTSEATGPLTEDEIEEGKKLESVIDWVGDEDVETRLNEYAEEGIKLREMIPGLEQQLSSAKEKYATVKGSYEKLQSTYDLLSSLQRSIEQLNRWTEGRDPESKLSCPCCGQGMTVQDGHRREEEIERVIEHVNDQLSESSKPLDDVDNCESALVDARENLEALTYRVRTLAEYREVDPHERFTVLAERHVKHKTAKTYDKEFSRLTDERMTLDALRKGLQKIRSDMSDDFMIIAANRINKLLPSRIRTKIEKSGSLGHGCRVVVSVEGGPHRPFGMLGGAEKALVRSAFASAFVPKGSDNVIALIIDEVWLDRPRTTDLIGLVDQAVESATGPSQVVLSVVEYGGRLPEDWTIVRLDSESPEALKAPSAPADETPPRENGDLFSHPSDRDIPSSIPEPPPPEESKTNGTPKLIGTLNREDKPIPVYYLGSFARFTEKAKQSIRDVPEENKVQGMIGVALSGKSNTMKFVSLYDQYARGANITKTERSEIEGMIKGMDAS